MHLERQMVYKVSLTSKNPKLFPVKGLALKASTLLKCPGYLSNAQLLKEEENHKCFGLSGYLCYVKQTRIQQ